jgi:hypothetical protein
MYSSSSCRELEKFFKNSAYHPKFQNLSSKIGIRLGGLTEERQKERFGHAYCMLSDALP